VVDGKRDKLATLQIIQPAVANHSLAGRFLRAKEAAVKFETRPALKLSVADRGQNGRMTRSNEHLYAAEECLQTASLVKSDADKLTRLTLFNGWLLLSNLRQSTEQKLAKSRPKLEIAR